AGVIEVAELVRALILEVMRFAPDYDQDGREGRIVSLLLDELRERPGSAGEGVAMPDDPRLARVCRAILADPACGDDLDRWAALAGMGRRTLTRHFRVQTGMSLAEWRQQVRLLEALARLEMGQSVTSVALDVGYESLSAFATVFQKRFGRSPGCFGGRLGGRLGNGTAH
ncbi:MAG: helix-turn-helix transcriptional regulator, partial [Gluconacetobacter diazotrophicus]|nr:helix-turn-helix transcriptional regulator [Gluconacetobacter diazotrophicus]